MTKSETLAILTEAEAKRLMSRGNPVQCERCHKLIPIDSVFVRKRKTGRGGCSTVYYHMECWNGMFHEVEILQGEKEK